MGDVDVVERDEQDEVTATVQDMNSGGTVDNLYVPYTWTDDHVERFEQAINLIPEEKRGVTMLKQRFGNFKRHYELLNRDSDSLKKTIDYINGIRHGGPKRDVTRSLRKVAQAFFDAMPEAMLYKHASRIFNLNPAMYDNNDALIAEMVEKQIAATAE